MLTIVGLFKENYLWKGSVAYHLYLYESLRKQALLGESCYRTRKNV